MPEFNISSGDEVTKNPTVVFVENGDNVTIFRGTPTNIRKIIFWIGDVVAPGWFEDEKLRETYMGYVDNDQVKRGEVELAEDGFLATAWDRVKSHLAVDGVLIHVVNNKTEE